MNTCVVNNLWDVKLIDGQVNKTANKLSIHYGICKMIVFIFSIFQSELQGRVNESRIMSRGNKVLTVFVLINK